jgi:hypothetical protein
MPEQAREIAHATLLAQSARVNHERHRRRALTPASQTALQEAGSEAGLRQAWAEWQSNLDELAIPAKLELDCLVSGLATSPSIDHIAGATP